MNTQKTERIHKNLSHAEFGSIYRCENEDIVSASIMFRDGAVGSIHMNGNSLLETPPMFMIHGTHGVLSMPNPANFSGEVKMYRPGSFEPAAILPCHGLDHDSRGAGAAELAWALRLGREPRADAALGLHCQEIIEGIRTSFETRKFYKMITECEKPLPLPKGFRENPALPGMFSYREEGALVL